MKIYEVWVNTHEDYTSRGYPRETFSSIAKAEAYIDELKKTVYKNYGASLWIEERTVK